MDTCSHRRMVVGSAEEIGPDDRAATCAMCGCRVVSFWIDGDEDRTGGWSRWKLAPLIIEEEQEPWSELVSSAT